MRLYSELFFDGFASCLNLHYIKYRIKLKVNQSQNLIDMLYSVFIIIQWLKILEAEQFN